MSPVPHPAQPPLPPLRLARLLWAAFLLSLPIYLVVFLLVQQAAREVGRTVVVVLTAAGLACVAAAALVHRAARPASLPTSPNHARRRLLDIVTYALLEAAAIHGFLLGFLGGGVRLLLPLWALALAGLLVVFPRPSDYPEGRPFAGPTPWEPGASHAPGPLPPAARNGEGP